MEVLNRDLTSRELWISGSVIAVFLIPLVATCGIIIDFKTTGGFLSIAETDRISPGHIWLYNWNLKKGAVHSEEVLWIKEELTPGNFTEETKSLGGNFFPFDGHSGSESGKSSNSFKGLPIVGLKIIDMKVEPQRGIDTYGNPIRKKPLTSS